MISLEVMPVVVNMKSFNELNSFAEKKGLIIKFHLKLDTGMHRFGLPVEELNVFVKEYKKSGRLKLTGVMTHLSCSEKPEHELTELQLKKLKKGIEFLKMHGINPEYIHFANTGGIIFLSEKGNLVRPGIGLFGGYPDKRAKELVKLYPVMTLKSHIVEIKRLKKGEFAGYGPNFFARRDTILGLVPVGYGDGYLRSLSNRGFAFCKNKRVAVAGSVSMKALYLDLTEVESPEVGDEVILLGGENNEVPADELAEAAGTISYELFCSLGKTIPREYKNV